MNPSSADTAPSCIWPDRESVGSSQCTAIVLSGDGAVLERTPHERRRDDRAAVVGEAGGARVGELAHLGQLAPSEPLEIAARNPTGTSASALRALDERAEHGGRVDDRLGVGHGEDGAVAACRGGARAGSDRLLVLAAGRAQVDVGIDEGGREHEPGAVDDAMAVRVDVVSELRDHAVVDADVEHGVDAARRIEDARAADDEAVLRSVLAVEHHATSISTPASTATGPWVSRS